MNEARLVNPGRGDDEAQYEAGLRPRTLDEYIGQERCLLYTSDAADE